MIRAKMSTIMKNGVNIHSKAVTTQVFTVVYLIVELSTTISNPKGSIYESTSIRS